MSDVDAARITHADRAAPITHADRAAEVSHAVANQATSGPLTAHLQFFADYENWNAGDPLPNRWTDNSGIQEFADNNGVGEEMSTPLVGSKSGDYTFSEYHSHSAPSDLDSDGGEDLYLAVWINPDFQDGNEIISHLETAVTFSGAHIAMNGAGVPRFGIFDQSGSFHRASAASALSTSSANFLEGWTDLGAGEISFRVNDGTIQTTSIPSYEPAAGNSGFRIGSRPDGTRFVNGIVDHAAVEVAPQGGLEWPSESTWLYNGGDGRTWDEIKTYQP